jgi:hypothetical protein
MIASIHDSVNLEKGKTLVRYYNLDQTAEFATFGIRRGVENKIVNRVAKCKSVSVTVRCQIPYLLWTYDTHS